MKNYQLVNTPMQLLSATHFSARSNYQLNFIYQNQTDSILGLGKTKLTKNTSFLSSGIYASGTNPGITLASKR
tara:strand:- start:203 stop:421 length:219 start_codon:yes stop_codon:yes gene_type:complete